MLGQDIEYSKVNKFSSDWFEDVLFTSIKIRAILRPKDDVVTRINLASRLRKRLRREYGEEGENWFFYRNSKTKRDEVYLKNSSILMMWKLQDKEFFDSTFERVERHVDNIE